MMRSPLAADADFPEVDASHSLFDVFASVLLNLITSTAIIGGGFFCFFCSF